MASGCSIDWWAGCYENGSVAFYCRKAPMRCCRCRTGAGLGQPLELKPINSRGLGKV